MDLVNPNASAVYNTSWSVEWEGYPHITLMCCFAGVTVSVISMLVPWPQLATSHARQATLSGVTSLNLLMDDMYTYYCRQSPSVEVYRMQKHLKDIHEFMSVTESHLAGSWWEAMFVDFGRWGVGSRIRQHLTRHTGLMRRMCDNADA